jgi:hypothetical protein
MRMLGGLEIRTDLRECPDSVILETFKDSTDLEICNSEIRSTPLTIAAQSNTGINAPIPEALGKEPGSKCHAEVE